MAVSNEQIEGILKGALKKFALKESAPITDVKIIICSEKEDNVTPEYFLQVANNPKRKLKFAELYMGMFAWSAESGARTILSQSIRKVAGEKSCKTTDIEVHVCASDSDSPLYCRLIPEQEEIRLTVAEVIAKR